MLASLACQDSARATGAPFRRRLFVRQLDQDDARPLPGTETASNGFFSPDGTAVGFVLADRTLRTASLADGLVAMVARGVDRNLGGTWGPGGITFVRDGALWQASPSGALVRQLTTVDRANGEIFHAWPTDAEGGGVLFTTVMGNDRDAMRIEAIAPGTGRRHVVPNGGLTGFGSLRGY